MNRAMMIMAGVLTLTFAGSALAKKREPEIPQYVLHVLNFDVAKKALGGGPYFMQYGRAATPEWIDYDLPVCRAESIAFDLDPLANYRVKSIDPKDPDGSLYFMTMVIETLSSDPSSFFQITCTSPQPLTVDDLRFGLKDIYELRGP